VEARWPFGILNTSGFAVSVELFRGFLALGVQEGFRKPK
jgi:hypothetical protein